MSTIGYIQVRAFASRARLPLADVAVMITRPDGTALAMRVTDRSGLTPPVPVSVPDKAASEAPDMGIVPYTNVNLYARLENFEHMEAEDVQVFADTVTYQDLEMIPLSELPDRWTQRELFRTPPQNL